jgi:phosphoribosyl-dephospho-CoA transferase
MMLLEFDSPQVHDLLEIERGSLATGSIAQPPWVRKMLIDCPWVVVRRALAPGGHIAVGVRGVDRSERWSGYCAERRVKRIARPATLLALGRTGGHVYQTPAFVALREVIRKWRGVPYLWGPTGSVGFELATGRAVTTEASDLDLAIRAPSPIGVEEARWLWDHVVGLQTKVDVRVETPVCGFSLEEYACASPAQILLRFPDAPRLGDHPWGL